VPAEARYFQISIEGEVTGIRETHITNGTNDIYDLQGRKVRNAAAKGMYIVNGKKVVK
jgi:hypothetical protein